jgi:hypothetical protein
MMRDLREELLNIRGRDFPKWYSSLTKLEKVEYSHILDQLSKEFRS